MKWIRCWGIVVCGFVSSVVWGQGHLLRTFPVGLHTIEEVARIDPKIHSQLNENLGSIGVFRAFCNDRSDQRGTAYLLQAPGGKRVVRTAAHAVKPYRDKGCQYRFKTRAFLIGLDDSFLQTYDESNDIAEFKLDGVSLPDRFKGLRMEPEFGNAAVGTPILAVGYPNTKPEGTPMVCFGHILGSFDGQKRLSTACAEPSMSGGAVFSIGAEGTLELYGTSLNAADMEGLLGLNLETNEKRVMALISLNQHNRLVRSSSRREIESVLDGTAVRPSDATSSGWLVSPRVFEVVKKWSEAIEHAMDQADEDQDAAMSEFRESAVKIMGEAPFIVADVPILPQGETFEASKWKEELGRSQRAVLSFEKDIEEKRKILSGFEMTEAFSNRLLATGIHSDPQIERSLTFPLVLFVR